MVQKIIQYIVVCEGSSERAYIQELNRYLREKTIPIVFIPQSSNGGQYRKVVQKYREVRRANRKSVVWIWIDRDRYVRNDNDDAVKYRNKSKDIPDFLFTTMNFEDFLAMHLPDEQVNKWIFACNGRNHFVFPSFSKEYLPEFESLLFSHYEKGGLPIEIDSESLNNLKKHQEKSSIPFKCDFAENFLALISEHILLT